MWTLTNNIRSMFDMFLTSVGIKRSGTHESEADLVKPNGINKDSASATHVDQDTSTSLLQDKKPEYRVFKTICQFYGALVAGWNNPLYGNTLVHMEHLFNVSTANMSFAFPAMAIAGQFGAVLCGLVFDRVNHEVAFAVASLFAGLSIMIAPFLGGLVPFIAATSVRTACVVFIATGSQSYCVGLWAEHRYRDSILHATHATWSLGAMTGPLIIDHFLVELPQQLQPASTTDTTSYASTVELTTPSSWNLTSVNSSVLPLDINVPGVEKVIYAYVTIGSLALVSPVLYASAFLLHFIKGKRSSSATMPTIGVSKQSTYFRLKESNDDQTAEQSSNWSKSDSENTPMSGDFKRQDRCLYLIFIALVCLFYHVYRYGQAVPLAYMTTFVIKYLNFPVQSASLLMSVFFALQFIGRIIGIPAAVCLQPRTMLIFNVVSTAIFFVLLLAFVNVWPAIVWITLPLASFAMATTYASAMLWVNNRVSLTGRLTAIMQVGYLSGAIIGPFVVGQLFDSSTPMWFAYVLAASSVSNVVLMFIMNAYDAHYGNRVARYVNKDNILGNDNSKATSMNTGGYNSISERNDVIRNFETSELETPKKTDNVK